MKSSFLTSLFDLIAPRSCAVCGHLLTRDEAILCGGCHMQLPLTDFAAHPYDNPLARLFWGQFPIERAAAYFYFVPHSLSSRIVYLLKYGQQPEVGEDMGAVMARTLKKNDFIGDIDAVVPIPITRRRRWNRGYNQSEEIARGIGEETGLPVLNKVVKRVRFDGSQTKKKGWERVENVESAFLLVKPEAVRGKHLLIVDDIITTGATITACARELCKAGEVRVSVVSLGFTKTR